MQLATLEDLATVVGALILANERLTELLKQLLGLVRKWVVAEQETPSKDAPREATVQLLAILTALFVAAWVAGGSPIAWGSSLVVGTKPDTLKVPVFVLAVLTSGGSSFWNGVIDFVRAAAKVRGERAALTREMRRSHETIREAAHQELVRIAAESRPITPG